jgi:uncharacterized protein with FMN-binding domain
MKTKKMTLILLALLIVCPVIHGQKNVDQLFKEFSKVNGVERVNIGNITFKFASLFTDVMGVSGVEVLSFDNCEQSVKDKLDREIASFKDGNYETLVSANEGKDRTKVLVKIKDESIKEILVLAMGESLAIIRIKGNIKPSDIDKVIKENKSSK